MSPPTVAVEVHGFAQALAPGGRVPTTLGLGGEVDVGQRAFVALTGELGPAGPDAYAALRVGAGWHLAGPWAVTLGAGPTIRYRASAATVALGLTREWPRGDQPALRIGLRALAGGNLTSPQGGVQLTVGLSDPVRAKPTLQEPIVTPPAPNWSFDPSDARIWVPHPVCDWLTPEEFAAAAPALPPDVVARAFASGRLPTNVPRSGGAVTLRDAPQQGSIVIAASPGDRVTVAAMTLPAEQDNIYVANVPIGAYTIQIVGGGRQIERNLDVAAGEASWLAVREPEEVRVYFEVGSNALRPATLATLDAWRALAGDARLTVSGGASPEGNDDENRALAASRAVAVYDALIASGIPKDHLRLGPVLLLDPTAEPQAQRVVILTPRGPR